MEYEQFNHELVSFQEYAGTEAYFDDLGGNAETGPIVVQTMDNSVALSLAKGTIQNNRLGAWNAIMKFGLESSENLQTEFNLLIDELERTFGIELLRSVDGESFNKVHDLITDLEKAVQELADDVSYELTTPDERREISNYNMWTD